MNKTVQYVDDELRERWRRAKLKEYTEQFAYRLAMPNREPEEVAAEAADFALVLLNETEKLDG